MKLLKYLLLCCLLPACVQAAAQDESDIVEVVVTGRQPGPPLWRVSNGENVLWILPLVSVVPKDMVWEDDRVAGVIAESQEFITSPDISVGVSKAVLLNPINWIRGPRLLGRISKNPDGARLHDVLPADTYARYAALKAKYFPAEDKIDTLRPSFAMDRISDEIQKAEKLTSSGDIAGHVDRLARRQRHIVHTDVKLEATVEGSYRELSERVEAMTGSMAIDKEIACFERQLVRFERHLNDMKEVANAWATGNARDIEEYSGLGSLQDPCADLMLASTEGEFVEDLLTQSIQRWLDAAINALENNRSTLTVLPMDYINGGLSLTDRLVEMGYTLHVPN